MIVNYFNSEEYKKNNKKNKSGLKPIKVCVHRNFIIADKFQQPPSGAVFFYIIYLLYLMVTVL